VKRLAAGLLAALIAAICSYVAVADNVQFGFWGWDRLPDRISFGESDYVRVRDCLSPPRGQTEAQRATLWTVIGPRRPIFDIRPVLFSPQHLPPALYIEHAEGCIAMYRLRNG
jgi:hypothetical protein